MLGLVGLYLTGCPQMAELRRPVAWLGSPIELGALEPSRQTRQIVLLTLDGVRWQEVFLGADPKLAAAAGLSLSGITDTAGLLPNMHERFFEGGIVIGAPGEAGGIFASGPHFISLPGYLEILRGRTVPSCLSNDCPPIREPTILDEIRALPGSSREDAAAFSSWHEIVRAASGDPGSVVVSTGKTQGSVSELSWADPHCDRLLVEGQNGSREPGGAAYRPDRHTASVALCYLAAVRPKMLWIGLGDTDEHAHRGDYAAYLDALRFADDFVGAIFDQLANMGEYGQTTTVIVTTDHGRGPEFPDHGDHISASRVFLFMAGGSVPGRGIIGTERAHRLADIAPTIRKLLGMTGEHEPDLEISEVSGGH